VNRRKKIALLLMLAGLSIAAGITGARIYSEGIQLRNDLAVLDAIVAEMKPQNLEFPACPDCHNTRDWIIPRGKVVCGKCCEVRFVLVSIQYQPVS